MTTVTSLVYYTIAHTCTLQILDGLRFTIHKQFMEFMKRHPTFLSNGGTISILAHSLGSVLTYDLLYETCAAFGVEHDEPPDCVLGPQPSGNASGSKSKSGSGLPRKVELKEVSDSVVFTAGLQSPESSLQSDQPMSPQSGYDEPGKLPGSVSWIRSSPSCHKRPVRNQTVYIL